MGHASLEPAHRLLICLAVAARNRDPVLVSQIAERADRLLTPKEMRRSFARLPSYGVGSADLDWLQGFHL
jgi:hypothetical protein